MLNTSTEKGKTVTDQSLIREVFPRHTYKRLALLCRVPLATAAHWAKVKVSSYRRSEIFLRLLEEHDRETERRAEIRQRLCIRAGLVNEVEIMDQTSVVASVAADLVGLAAAGCNALERGTEAAIDWLEE